jgi:hypothetical protein
MLWLCSESKVGLMSTTPEEKLQRKINLARTTNAGLTREIQSLGGDVDLSTARLEVLTTFLVEIGVLTEEQRLQEQLKWEVNLKPQLIAMRDTIRDRRKRELAAQEAQAERLRALQQMQEEREKKPPEGGPKLIVPGR